ncbi:hypothetical protein Tco_0355240 [Tanacetum coccineum]
MSSLNSFNSSQPATNLRANKAKFSLSEKIKILNMGKMNRSTGYIMLIQKALRIVSAREQSKREDKEDHLQAAVYRILCERKEGLPRPQAAHPSEVLPTLFTFHLRSSSENTTLSLRALFKGGIVKYGGGDGREYPGKGIIKDIKLDKFENFTKLRELQAHMTLGFTCPHQAIGPSGYGTQLQNLCRQSYAKPSQHRSLLAIDSAGRVSAVVNIYCIDPAVVIRCYEPTVSGNPAAHITFFCLLTFILYHADESTLPLVNHWPSENTTTIPAPSDVMQDQLSSLASHILPLNDDDFSALQI